jgi:N-acetylmuramoyl-L-alanine amidase
MQYGGMGVLRMSGWVAVIIAAPALLIIGIAAAHRASAPPRSARAGGTAPVVNSYPAVAGPNAGGQGLSTGTGVAVDPAYFGPGACVAFPPVTGNRHLTVFLDAGHGGLDPGAVGVTGTGKVIDEADQTLPDGGVQSDQGLGSSLSPADLAYGHLLLLGPAERGYFSTPSTMPGALVEPLFITDPFEGSIAASSRGQQVIAGGLARAVEQYFAPPAP